MATTALIIDLASPVWAVVVRGVSRRYDRHKWLELVNDGSLALINERIESWI